MRTKSIRALRVIVLGVAITAGTAAPAGAGGGGCHGERTTARGTHVELSAACFSPTVLHVEPGDTVTFENVDPMPHVVMGVGWGSMENLDQGDTVRHTFAEPGAHPYTCNLHPGMNGVVMVGDGAAELSGTPIASTADPGAGDDDSTWWTAVFALVVAAGSFVAGRWSRRRLA